MLKAYSLRPEYEGTLAGGTVTTGPDAGTMDILEEIQKGNGEIITGDSMLQSILENLHGEFGLLFNIAMVTGENNENREKLPSELGPPPAPQQPGATAPPPGTGPVPVPPSPPISSAGAPAGATVGGDVGTLPGAQHGDQSEYATFSEEELRQVVEERGLGITPETTHEELVNLLEQDDLNRQEGAGSGS